MQNFRSFTPFRFSRTERKGAAAHPLIKRPGRTPAVIFATAVLLTLPFCGIAQPEDHPARGTLRSPGAAGGAAGAVSTGRATRATGFRIVKVTPHDPNAFTEGLVFADGFLYESTGMHGVSSVRKVDIPTGRVLKITRLPQEYFGEGLTVWRGALIQLTWRSHVGFVYDRGSFSKLREFGVNTEGWGLTQDGESLIMSDGTAVLRFLDPETFRETQRLPVTDGGIPVQGLNELEYIDGEIFANIWQEDVIARISPQSGEVLGWLDLSGLRKLPGGRANAEVLNGIAFDPQRKRIFVTGKYWPGLFELELLAPSP